MPDPSTTAKIDPVHLTTRLGEDTPLPTGMIDFAIYIGPSEYLNKLIQAEGRSKKEMSINHTLLHTSTTTTYWRKY